MVGLARGRDPGRTAKFGLCGHLPPGEPMGSTVEIRAATSADTNAISHTIVRALRETNARDYPAHVIAAVAENFSPERVAAQIAARQVYVAVIDGVVIGTASLHSRVVRSVYVDPQHQGKGVGARLMDTIEQLAREQTIDTLSVPASITAQAFYQQRGYVVVRDEFHGDERTIIMKKSLDRVL
jgi:N-acetylglutamate synthase-like GNAT family acetyltransferase